MATDSGSKPRRLAGQEDANVDDKGRVLFSKRKREILGDEFVMRLGDNGCIYVYSQDEWETSNAEMDAYPRSNQGRQMYTRLVLGTAAEELSFDAQGRTVIPRMLRDMAKIRDRVVIIGCDERVEIWASDEFDKMKAAPMAYGRERADLIHEALRQMRGNL